MNSILIGAVIGVFFNIGLDIWSVIEKRQIEKRTNI